VVVDIDINVAQAALGDEIDVPLVDGQTQRMAIPAGSQFGDVLTLREKGVPDLRSGRRGDQLIRLKVVVPRSLTETQKKILGELAQSLGSDVRPQEGKGILDSIKDALGV
jgi:molecular chaperone DnaJ